MQLSQSHYFHLLPFFLYLPCHSLSPSPSPSFLPFPSLHFMSRSRPPTLPLTRSWLPSQVSLKLLCLFHFLTFLLFTLFWDSMCIHKLKFCLPLYLYVSTKKSKSEGVISTLIVSGEILPDIFFLFVFRTKSYCMSFSLG